MRGEVIYKFFLNLRNAYYSLNMESCLDILLRYGIGPRTERILWIYWEHLIIVT